MWLQLRIYSTSDHFLKLHEPLDEHNLKEITIMLTKKTFEDKKEARKVISIS